VPGGSTCGTTIAAGAVCSLMYRFRPLNSDGTLREDGTSIAFTGGGEFQSVALAFAGRGNGALVHVAPRVIDFGDQLLGDTATVKVFVANIGTDTATSGSFAFPTSNGFFGNNGCGTVAPGATCFHTYSFAPTQLGAVENATSVGAWVASPVFSQSYSIDVRGRGVGAPSLVSVFPVQFDFGEVLVGSEAQVEVRYKNLGGSPITYAGGAIVAPFESQPVDAPGCQGGAGADPGATCTFRFYFRPLATGPAAGSTTFTFSRPGSAQNVEVVVSGTGVGQIGRVWPATMDFGEVRLGSTISAPVTITNTTRLPLTGFIGGAVFPPFSSTNNCPVSLAVGQSCRYDFTFTANASSYGPQTATTSLSFSNADNVQPVYTVTLLAEGYDRLFSHGFE
jgi:hypothetical protein